MSESDKIILKKYSNRRLYDTVQSAYVTLNDVSDMVKQGQWVEVTDVKSGEDVTAFTLTQIIMEEAKNKNALLPVPLLHLIIRYGETLLADFFGKYLEKMVRSYLSYKQIADEQFNKWLDIGVSMSGMGSGMGLHPHEETNPLQSFFKQFMDPSKFNTEAEDKKNPPEE
ncbi:MAG: transcriptional regulator [Deltaproteobacteria bacterium]|nr:transcriptional regulator [Deltaproteobacteria bacterium]